MATLEKRTWKNGKTTWRVLWRESGERTLHRESFETEEGALRWKRCLEELGSEVALRLIEQERTGIEACTVEAAVHDHIEALTGVTTGTRKEYRRILTQHIGPAFRGVRVDALRRVQVASWVNAMAEAGTAPKTIRNRHALLSAALTTAVREGQAPANVAEGVRLPRVTPEEMVFLTQVEFATIVAMMPARWQPLTLLLGSTGMRWGEATALQVKHVDVRDGELRIVQAWKESRDWKRELGPTKTARSTRTLPIPTGCTAMLAQLTDGRRRDDWLFTMPDGSAVPHQRFYRTGWAPTIHRFAGDIQTRIEITPKPGTTGSESRRRTRPGWDEIGEGKRPRIHDLRHSYASWAISAGHSLTALQRILGHESIKTTSDTYGHLFRADRDAFADLVALPTVQLLAQLHSLPAPQADIVPGRLVELGELEPPASGVA